MIPALLCLALPVLSGCSAYVEAAPAVNVLEKRRACYSHKRVRVRGEVRELRQLRARLSGRDYEVFMLCRDGCVRVYMPAHSPIFAGERVAIRGTYYLTHREGREVYHDEIVATEIVQE